MYAVVVTGGKQYRVMQGETLRVEMLEVEAGKRDQVRQRPDARRRRRRQARRRAQGRERHRHRQVGHGRADKVRIVKFRRRKHHRKQMGHRQHYTEIEITGIAGGDKK